MIPKLLGGDSGNPMPLLRLAFEKDRTILVGLQDRFVVSCWTDELSLADRTMPPIFSIPMDPRLNAYKFLRHLSLDTASVLYFETFPGSGGPVEWLSRLSPFLTRVEETHFEALRLKAFDTMPNAEHDGQLNFPALRTKRIDEPTLLEDCHRHYKPWCCHL